MGWTQDLSEVLETQGPGTFGRSRHQDKRRNVVGSCGIAEGVLMADKDGGFYQYVKYIKPVCTKHCFCAEEITVKEQRPVKVCCTCGKRVVLEQRVILVEERE